MEVQKRVQLKTLDKPKEVEAKPLRLAVRFEIKLEESTDDKCPEISYTDLLLKHEMKRRRASMSSNSMMSDTDLFGAENEENLEALAKQMEEKYGKAYGGLSRGRHMDLGDGYDTEDSFIDNEEAYDELVPSSLTTQHGGFYINTGVLDFKEVSDDEIVSDSGLKPKKKKRVVSSSGSERENKPAKEPVKKRRKKTLAVSTAETSAKKALLTKKRKKILATDKLDKERIKKKKILLQKKKRLVERPQINLSEKELDVKAKQYDSLIDDVINSQVSLEGPQQATASSSETVSTTTDAAKGKDLKAEPVKLPENLSDRCLLIINTLKQAASKCVDEKSRFFTNDINSQLTSLDVEVRKIGSALTRNAVYSHLSSFLPINRETLMKRMKLLRLKELSGKLRQPLDDLKAAINEEMPGQIERFNQEAQARLTSKQEDIEKQKEDTQDSDDEWQSGFPNQPTTSGAQSLPTSTTADAAAADEKKKEKAPPACRKKYEWTEKVREKLCAVITIKMESYEFLKAKGQTPEIYLKEFLENEIRILWPKGWMQSRVLYRESKAAHVKWTNPSAQIVTAKPVPKKPALITNALKMATNISTKKTSQPVKGSTANKGVEAVNKSTVLPSSTTGAEVKDAKPTAGLPVASTSAKSLNKCQGAASKLVSVAEASPSTSAQPFPLSKASVAADHSKTQKPTSTTTEKKEVKTIFDSPSSSTDSKGFGVMPSASVPSVSGMAKAASSLATFKQASNSFSTSSKGNDLSAPNSCLTNSSTFTKVTSVLSSNKVASPLNTPVKVTITSSASVKGVGTSAIPIKVSTSSLAASGRAGASAATPVKVVTAPATSSRVGSSQLTNKAYTIAEGIPSVTLSDSPSPSKTWAIPVNSSALNLGKVANRQHSIVKVQSDQAATAIAAQNAKILQEKHLAASLASQKNMLKHKKIAETLSNTQNIVKQQQMAAIQAEQKAAASRAAQQQISQLTLAHKQKLAQKQFEEQQKLVHLQQTRLQAQQKILQGQQPKLVHVSPSQQQKIDQNQSHKLAQAQQHKLVSSAQLELAKQKLAQEQQKMSSASALDTTKQTRAQQAQYFRLQLQQQRTQWQRIQQLANQPAAQSSTQQKPVQYSNLSSSPTTAAAKRGSSAQATPPAIPTTSSPHIASYSFTAPNSSQTPASPSSTGSSPTWPIATMQQQQQLQQAKMAEYRRLLSKKDDK